MTRDFQNLRFSKNNLIRICPFVELWWHHHHFCFFLGGGARQRGGKRKNLRGEKVKKCSSMQKFAILCYNLKVGLFTTFEIILFDKKKKKKHGTDTVEEKINQGRNRVPFHTKLQPSVRLNLQCYRPKNTRKTNQNKTKTKLFKYIFKTHIMIHKMYVHSIKITHFHFSPITHVYTLVLECAHDPSTIQTIIDKY